MNKTVVTGKRLPLPYRLFTNAIFSSVLKRRRGLGGVSLLLPILKRALAFYPSPLPPRVREDTFDMVTALWASGLRVGVPQKMAELLRNILTSAAYRTREDAPGFMVISPGKACNLRCPDCYANAASERDILRYEILRRVVQEAKKFWQMPFFVISGGEPFMYRDGENDILNLAGENQDCLFLIFTNGTLIDSMRAQKIAALGNVTPAISVEGFIERTESRRGKGVFDRILKAMENLRTVGVPFGLSLTVTRDNAEELLSDRFLDFFFDQEGAAYAWLFHYMPIGRNPNPEIMPTPAQRVWLWQRSWEIIRKKRVMIADFWNHGTVSQGCIAGGRPGGYFHIDWKGDVSPCVFFPYAATNINELYRNGRTLEDVLKTPLFCAVREWQKGYGFAQPALTVETNWLMPCPIRDHHKEAVAIINSLNPVPTDCAPSGALNNPNYIQQMAEYNRQVNEATQKIWQGYVHS